MCRLTSLIVWMASLSWGRERRLSRNQNPVSPALNNGPAGLGLQTGTILQSKRLKRTVSRDFLAFFLFHESNPSGPLINRLKCFCLKIVFVEIFTKNLNPRKFDNPKLANTASEESDSAQANTARSWTSRRLTNLRGVKQIFLILENLNFQVIGYI